MLMIQGKRFKTVEDVVKHFKLTEIELNRYKKLNIGFTAVIERVLKDREDGSFFATHIVEYEGLKFTNLKYFCLFFSLPYSYEIQEFYAKTKDLEDLLKTFLPTVMKENHMRYGTWREYKSIGDNYAKYLRKAYEASQPVYSYFKSKQHLPEPKEKPARKGRKKTTTQAKPKKTSLKTLKEVSNRYNIPVDILEEYQKELELPLEEVVKYLLHTVEEESKPKESRGLYLWND